METDMELTALVPLLEALTVLQRRPTLSLSRFSAPMDQEPTQVSSLVFNGLPPTKLPSLFSPCLSVEVSPQP